VRILPPVHCHCCSGGCGEAGGGVGGSGRVRKEGRAPRAEGVALGVWVGVEGWVREVGAAGEGVM
jgi:hypothetical protein